MNATDMRGLSMAAMTPFMVTFGPTKAELLKVFELTSERLRKTGRYVDTSIIVERIHPNERVV